MVRCSPIRTHTLLFLSLLALLALLALGTTTRVHNCEALITSQHFPHVAPHTLPFFLVVISRRVVNPFQCAWILDAAPPNRFVSSAIFFCSC